MSITRPLQWAETEMPPPMWATTRFQVFARLPSRHGGVRWLSGSGRGRSKCGGIPEYRSGGRCRPAHRPRPGRRCKPSRRALGRSARRSGRRDWRACSRWAFTRSFFRRVYFIYARFDRLDQTAATDHGREGLHVEVVLCECFEYHLLAPVELVDDARETCDLLGRMAQGERQRRRSSSYGAIFVEVEPG